MLCGDSVPSPPQISWIDCRNRADMLPLHWAVARSNVKIKDLLLQAASSADGEGTESPQSIHRRSHVALNSWLSCEEDSEEEITKDVLEASDVPEDATTDESGGADISILSVDAMTEESEPCVAADETIGSEGVAEAS